MTVDVYIQGLAKVGIPPETVSWMSKRARNSNFRGEKGGDFQPGFFQFIQHRRWKASKFDTAAAKIEDRPGLSCLSLGDAFGELMAAGGANFLPL